jgi:hypothetical protein
MQGPKEEANQRKTGRPPKTSYDIEYIVYKHRSLLQTTVFSSVVDIKIKNETLPEKLCSYVAARVNSATEELELGEHTKKFADRCDREGDRLGE